MFIFVNIGRNVGLSVYLGQQLPLDKYRAQVWYTSHEFHALLCVTDSSQLASQPAKVQGAIRSRTVLILSVSQIRGE